MNGRSGIRDHPLAQLRHSSIEPLRSAPESCAPHRLARSEAIRHHATLAAAIDRVGRGETVVDPELVDLLLRRPQARSHLDELTAREREVLAVLAEGLNDRGISERLQLPCKTVETHVRHLLNKLGLAADGLHNRRVLAVFTYLSEAGAADRDPRAPTA